MLCILRASQCPKQGEGRFFSFESSSELHCAWKMAPSVKDPSFYLNMASFDFDVDPFQSFTFDTFLPDVLVSEPAVQSRLHNIFEMALPSHLEVEVNAERKFVLHKAPLVERSELFRQLVEEATDATNSPSSPRTLPKRLSLQIDDLPGGSEAFELVARFCFDDAGLTLTSANVAKLRCAAEFLRMTEATVKENLIRRTEEFLRTVVFWSWEESLIVLRSCEDFIQAAEKTQIIQRCASVLSDKTSPAASVFVELSSSPLHPATDAYLASYLMSTPSGTISHRSSKAATETWWFDDLSTLSVHLMESVVRVMITHRAADSRVIAKFLLHYLRSALPVLGYSSTSLSPMKLHGEGDEDNSCNHGERMQREVVEVVVNLLYNLDRKCVSCRSLLGLRRIAVARRAGKHCRRDLERMIGRQLDKATLDNILILALPPRCSSLYDVDLVLRLVEFFLKEKAEALMLPLRVKRSDSFESLYSGSLNSKFSSLSRSDSRTSVPGAMSADISEPVQMSLLKVGELMDKYLAEIAADTNLKPSKFLVLAESLPDYARQSDDGLYRAVDIYLESHPFVSETDATRLFKVVNYHKLGAETGKAASQNPRFPPSFAIQLALVQQNQHKTAAGDGSFRSGRSCSPIKNASSRVGQQTVVSLQCSSFEFTLRQEKKKNIKKTQLRPEIQKSCKRSRVDMPGLYRLMQLFHSKARQN